ncbi:MAG: DUF4296 domain-containing protein [Muribaculaceae bacterium]|nr:DUF4296 domain-containing protein [Muribaculaceae bacterium]
MNRLSIYATLILLAAIIFQACDNRPDDVISENDAVNLLTDLQLAEAYMDIHPSQYASNDARNSLKLAILKKHGVTEAQFDSTINWYGHHIDKYTELYGKVTKKLEKERANINGTSNQSDLHNSLWPYPQMAMVSNLSPIPGLRFSTKQSIGRGDLLEWKMTLSNNTSVYATLGVEYTDGALSLLNRMSGGTKHFSIKLQTDSTRDVKRIFGLLNVTDQSSLPLWCDSIAILNTPLQPDRYSNFNYQNNLLPPGQNRKPKPQASLQTPTSSMPQSASSSMTTIPSSQSVTSAPQTPASASAVSGHDTRSIGRPGQ